MDWVPGPCARLKLLLMGPRTVCTEGGKGALEMRRHSMGRHLVVLSAVLPMECSASSASWTVELGTRRSAVTSPTAHFMEWWLGTLGRWDTGNGRSAVVAKQCGTGRAACRCWCLTDVWRLAGPAACCLSDPHAGLKSNQGRGLRRKPWERRTIRAWPRADAGFCVRAAGQMLCWRR